MYQVGSKTIARSELESESAYLLEAHASKTRPICLCKHDGVEMCLERVEDKVYVRRLPGQGESHAPSCFHFEPIPGVSGLAEVHNSAIKNTKEGQSKLVVGFSFNKMISSGSRKGPQPNSEPGDKAEVEKDPVKLTLRGTLHHLIHAAGFDAWAPGGSEQTIDTFSGRLIAAASASHAKGESLAKRLMIFGTDFDRNEVIKNAVVAHASASAPKGSKGCALVVGEFETVRSGVAGDKIVIAGAPGYFVIHAPVGTAKRINTGFENMIGLSRIDGNHAIAMCHISLTKSGWAELEGLSIIAVNSDFLPIESTNDLVLIDELKTSQIAFVKSLRYNAKASKLMPFGVTQADHPVVMICPPMRDENVDRTIKEITNLSKSEPWIWYQNESRPAVPGHDWQASKKDETQDQTESKKAQVNADDFDGFGSETESNDAIAEGMTDAIEDESFEPEGFDPEVLEG